MRAAHGFGGFAQVSATHLGDHLAQGAHVAQLALLSAQSAPCSPAFTRQHQRRALTALLDADGARAAILTGEHGQHAVERVCQAYARAMRLERQKGSLKVGKLPDMIVFDRDVLSVNPDALRDTQVLHNCCTGKQI